MKNHKYIFIVGGVMSGVGKGIACASIGKILQSRGFRVNPIKIDPYLNVDAGTMNPKEHGEVFVLESGLECDQDMGNYERFMDVALHEENYMTNGMVFKTVIDRERSLGYNGRCVEPLFHIVEESLARIHASVKKSEADITLVEIGGTVGEYQNALFVEAARTMKLRNPEDVIFVLVSYLPIPHMVGEMKTKPTQYAIRTMNTYGVNPDIIIARAERPLDDQRKRKIADFGNIPYENIISAPDVEMIYDVPLNFDKDGLSDIILSLLHMKGKLKSDMLPWRKMVQKAKKAEDEVTIALIGKYFKTGDYFLSDVYISVIESLKHAAYLIDCKPKFEWIDSLDYEEDPSLVSTLSSYDGILVPGGFGSRGIEGKIQAIRYVREKKIPYFGLCYGMQLALVEYARNEMGFADAHTTEVHRKTSHPVIDILPEQVENLRSGNYGASMRLGVYPAVLVKGTIAYHAYSHATQGRWSPAQSSENEFRIKERHRHRYEVNPEYVTQFEKNGVMFSGVSPDRVLMEIMELPQETHPFFVATQFHPEFTGSLLHPHPLFTEFIRVASERRKSKKK
ncbi:CTP synthase [Candidatus Uhrbacteria bacterium]|nr:CTP synthase [Candidatus Uhrbacteria bacterium]